MANPSRPATKHGREALSVIAKVLEPEGFEVKHDTLTKHAAIVAERDGRRRTFKYHLGSKTGAGFVLNYARQWARRVLAEEQTA